MERSRIVLVALGVLALLVSVGACSDPSVAGAADTRGDANNAKDATASDAPASNDGASGARDATACAPKSPPASAPPAAPLALYPAARYAVLTTLGASATTACVDTSALSTHATLDALVQGLLDEAGLTRGSFSPGAGCACDWTLAFAAQPPALDHDAAAAWTSAGTNADRYVVTSATSATTGRATSTLFAASEAAALYALRAALATLQHNAHAAGDAGGAARVATGTVVDWPSIARRGVVEGIYGPSNANADCARATAYWLPYRVQDRLELVQIMSRLRMNVFLYGPKCDAYSGPGGWMTPYSVAAGQVVGAAAREAEANLVRFVWAIRPLSFYASGTYASQLAALVAKLDQLRALGVRHFALFWDDSYNYAGTIDDQIRLINDVDANVKHHDAADHLTVVGQPYCGPADSFCSGPNTTTDAFGRGLHSDIEIFWTGTGVEPTTITAADLTGIDASYKRKVTIWDNWPCAGASYCGGPGFRGRSADLPSAIQGYYANPVLNEYNGPALPVRKFLEVLGPIGDFTWNAGAYAASAQSEDASYAKWQALLAALEPKVGGTCKPCGSYAAYWTCSAVDAHAIELCDPDTHCLSEIHCANGCEKKTNPLPDVCHF